MGFTTDYAVLVHHLNLHLEKFSQTPQGTSFTKLIYDWEKTYGYSYKFTKVQFYQLITTVTITKDKRRQAPGYNKDNDSIYGRMAEVPPHPMGISGQYMLEKVFFTGVESSLGIDNYPPVEIKTRHHSTIRDNTTITTLVK